MKILVTGGAGYIASHAIIELVKAGMEPVAVDNLSNSRPGVFDRLHQITGKKIPFYEVDITDTAALGRVFAKERPDAVMHFAAFKAVDTSVAEPLNYYRNNVLGMISVCEAMAAHNVKQIVFSSSATVYTGHPTPEAVTEEAPLAATNPYGQTKLMGEQILRDMFVSDPEWKVTILRYFNPVGAHESGLIGEDPQIAPDNLTPYVAQVLVGRLPYLRVFGNDYDTPDGTGVRDYTHVVDVAKAHLKAITYQKDKPGVSTFNLGTGQGHSVLEVIASFEKASGRKVDYKILGRRPGDIGLCLADPSLAERELGWKAEKSLDEMCADTWKWQVKNPNGYAETKQPSKPGRTTESKT